MSKVVLDLAQLSTKTAPLAAALLRAMADEIAPAVATPEAPLSVTCIADAEVLPIASEIPWGSSNPQAAEIPPLNAVIPPITGNAATAAPVNAAGATLDAEGFPHDVRIHASPAGINAGDGKFRAKRKLDPAIAAAVRAELRQLYPEPAAVTLPPPAAGAVIPPPPATPGGIMPPPPAAATGPTLVVLMRRVSLAVAGGAITREQVIEAHKSLGVATMADMSGRPDLFPAFDAALTAMGA